MFKQINIQIIPAAEQREGWNYGDYWIDEAGVLQIRVSEFDNPDYAIYIAIHELMEAWRYARKHGPDYSAIDRFDRANSTSLEPGRIPDAPYHDEHMKSEAIERLLCRQDGYVWKDYYHTEPKS